MKIDRDGNIWQEGDGGTKSEKLEKLFDMALEHPNDHIVFAIHGVPGRFILAYDPDSVVDVVVDTKEDTNDTTEGA